MTFSYPIIIEALTIAHTLGEIPAFNVGSTYRAGDAPYHGWGWAVDLPGTHQDALGQWGLNYHEYFLEVIHDSGTKRYGVKNFVINPAAYNSLWGTGQSGGRDNGHTLHVHLATTPEKAFLLKKHLLGKLSMTITEVITSVWMG